MGLKHSQHFGGNTVSLGWSKEGSLCLPTRLGPLSHVSQGCAQSRFLFLTSRAQPRQFLNVLKGVVCCIHNLPSGFVFPSWYATEDTLEGLRVHQAEIQIPVPQLTD